LPRTTLIEHQTESANYSCETLKPSKGNRHVLKITAIGLSYRKYDSVASELT